MAKLRLKKIESLTGMTRSKQREKKERKNTEKIEENYIVDLKNLLKRLSTNLLCTQLKLPCHHKKID